MYSQERQLFIFDEANHLFYKKKDKNKRKTTHVLPGFDHVRPISFVN